MKDDGKERLYNIFKYGKREISNDASQIADFILHGICKGIDEIIIGSYGYLKVNLSIEWCYSFAEEQANICITYKGKAILNFKIARYDLIDNSPQKICHEFIKLAISTLLEKYEKQFKESITLLEQQKCQKNKEDEKK